MQHAWATWDKERSLPYWITLVFWFACTHSSLCLPR